MQRGAGRGLGAEGTGLKPCSPVWLGLVGLQPLGLCPGGLGPTWNLRGPLTGCGLQVQPASVEPPLSLGMPQNA